jgi:hypothetical protein
MCAPYCITNFNVAVCVTLMFRSSRDAYGDGHRSPERLVNHRAQSIHPVQPPPLTYISHLIYNLYFQNTYHTMASTFDSIKGKIILHAQAS